LPNNDVTKDWKLYEAGKTYNQRMYPVDYYTLVETNTDFVVGDQWRNVNAQNMPKPVFNIIKRALQFQVANLTASKTKLHFEPLEHIVPPPGMDLIAPEDIANSAVNNILEKFKFDFLIKEIITDGAVTGDGCLHFFWDREAKPFGNAYGAIRGEIDYEVVDGTNIYFGNPNNRNTKKQPYIIVEGRDLVSNLEEEAKRYKGLDDEISDDNDFQTMAGQYGKIEADTDDYSKATYIIVYKLKKVKRKRKDEMGNEIEEEVKGLVASKSTKKAYIYEEVDTGLSCYPIAWFNWEKQKNTYHGRSLVTGMIPNQIFINRSFAMCFYHLQMTAFPKAVFNADVVESFSNEIGTAIPISGVPLETNIRNVAGYLEPGNMSGQIVEVINMAIDQTRESLGVNDALTGNVDPKNTSAIIATQRASSVPLENPRSNLYEWVENVGHILFDFMGTYYGLRPVGIEVDGQKTVVNYDFSVFKNLWLNIRADVGESSYWSEIATQQTLTNLLQGGFITIVDFLERSSNEYIPQRESLIVELKARQAQMEAQQAQMTEGATPTGAPPPQ
jgi:hypothetical protein